MLLLLLYCNLNPATAGSAHINAKKREERQGRRKGIEAQRAKPPTPSQAIDAHIGDEEHNGKQKKKQKQTRDRGAEGETSFPNPGK